MKRRNPSDFEQVASEARKICQDFAKSKDSVHLDIRPKDLTGMCAIASFVLRELLFRKNFKHPMVMYTKVHCWVECEGCLIDVTASQFPEFNGNPFVVLSMDNLHKFYKNLIRIHNPLPVDIDDSRFTAWRGQNPDEETIDLILEKAS